MPSINKPTIVYDFGRGDLRMAEELPRRAVIALEEHNRPVARLQQELRQYLRAKPLGTTRPRQLMRIVTKFVHVQPTDFHDMELVVGTESARQLVAHAEEIPPLLWDSIDYLSALYPYFGGRLRAEVENLINSRTGNRDEYFRVTMYWLDQAVTTPSEVRRWALRRRTSKRAATA